MDTIASPPTATSPDVDTKPTWFTDAKGRQMAAIFRAALPAGIAIYDNDTPSDLPFRRTEGREPGSATFDYGIATTAELRSVRQTDYLEVDIDQSDAKPRDCIDSGEGSTGWRVIQPDGTVIDRSERGVTPASTTSAPDRTTPSTSTLQVVVTRPDGTRIQAYLFHPEGGPLVLSLDEFAAVVSAPGFDISTPVSAYFSSHTTPSAPLSPAYASGGGIASAAPTASAAPASR